MAEQKTEKKKTEKKKTKTRLVEPNPSSVKFVPPGRFKPFSKNQQLGKSNAKETKAPKGGRR